MRLHDAAAAAAAAAAADDADATARRRASFLLSRLPEMRRSINLY